MIAGSATLDSLLQRHRNSRVDVTLAQRRIDQQRQQQIADYKK